MTPLHMCDFPAAHDGAGPAIESCDEKPNGELWIGNSEYGSQVCFCPYCGYKAKVQPKKVK